ncbi:hypothetical protein RQP46_000469 [Phenoliferia psychrophenolica]
MSASDPAAALVREDAWASRGINYNELPDVAEIHSVAEANYARERSADKGKGKGRAPLDAETRDDDDSEGEMGWEPAATEEQAERRRRSGEAQYQYPTFHENSDLARHVQHQPRRRSRSDSVSELDSHQRRLLWWKNAGINILYIGAWYTFSTLISVYSTSKDHYNFRYPLFVTSVHMLVQWFLATLTLYFFKGLRPDSRPQPRDYGMKVVPCGMATGLDIGLSNLSLRSITLSFYTMCKSSSLAFVLIFAFLFKLEKPSWRLAGIIFIITSGVVLMVSSETQFNLTGMVEVLTASALGGLRWSLIQILLDKESMGMGNPIATLFWLAPIMGLTLGTTSMLVDGWGNVFSQKEFFGSFALTLKTAGTIFFPGVIAFAMNVTEFGLIQRTSVVTLSVAGIFKEVAVIFLSMFIFHDQLTPINVSGLCVTIFGIGLYNYLKYSQFTNGEGSGGHGHGRPKTGFEAVPGESHGEEEDPMLSPRARNAARLLGASNESAQDFHDSDFAAPLHSLGGTGSNSSSSSLASSARSSVEVRPTDLYDTEEHHALHRTTGFGKAKQHAQGRVEGLEEQLFDADLELKEREVERNLDGAIEGHREADDWDLLGQEEEMGSFDDKKKA